MNHTTKKINTAKLLKTILSLVMVLSLLVGCSMMFVGCSGSGNNNETQPGSNKHDPAQYEGLSDKEYFQTLAYNHLTDATAALSKGYDAYMGGFNGSSSTGAKVGMTLTLGEPVLDLLEDATGGAMDFGFLSKVNLDMDVGTKDKLTQAKVALGLNGKNVATATMLMDAANYVMYMGVPELNSTYIKMDLSEMMASTGANINAESLAGAAAQLVGALPSGEKVASILNGYLEVALKEIDNVKRSTVKQELAGLKQDQSQVTVKLYQEDILDIAKAILEKAENDDDIKQIINDFVNAAAEASGESIDADTIYGSFRDSVKDALETVEASRENLDTENFVELKVYTDSNHNVVGLAMLPPETEGVEISYITVTEGDKTAMQLIGKEEDTTAFEIVGEGTIKNGKTSGTYTVEVMGEEIMTVEVKNLNAESGTITLKPTEDALSSMGAADLPFEDLALEIKLDKDEIELNALSGSKTLLGIALSVKESSVGSLKLPTKYVDGTDTNALMEWVSNANFDTLFNNLKKAGVPSDLVDSLGSMLGG